ncbi:uncharacterized protein LOC131686957 [Topomyia yanbarensis]|uniref:uncharacterized protein LOC131686957 n=1 Tax=Topomyia yanbarensis TaxID=2498891 RepID=UPI00273C4363|nr:uncharacterized protein LOC131686957 [Topomyia yanbarensis]
MAGCTEWCEKSQKNKMQTNTLLSGITTLILCGIFVGCSIFNVHIRYQTWTFNQPDSVILLIINLFYIAAILGSFAGAILVNHIEKLLISRIYLMLIAIASILQIIVPKSIVGTAFARIFAGSAYGLAYLTVLVHGGEVLVKEFRGMVIAAINHVLFLGILAHGTVSPVVLTDYDLESNRIIGIAGLTFALLAALIGQFMTYESPIFLVQKGRDAEAIQSLMKLSLESRETIEIRDAYIDIKVMLQEDSFASQSIFTDGNWRPLLLLSLGKIAAVLSFNAAVNQIQLIVVDQLYDLQYYSISGAIILGIRFLLGIPFVYTVDIFGRRPQQALSALLSGAVLTAMGIVYLVTDSVNPNVGGSIFLTYALVACTGVTLVPDIHLSEAFPTQKKALSIAVVQLVENGVQILILSVTFSLDLTHSDNYGGILLSCGVPLMVIAVVLYVLLPETIKLTLRQSRAAFARKESLYEMDPVSKDNLSY